MPFMGAGTRNSPIAIDDSEEEVFYELYDDSSKSSPQSGAPISLTQDRGTLSPQPTALDNFYQPSESRIVHIERKRKRAPSFTSQDMPTAASNTQRTHPSLVNRLSQPESKKARKRRRKAERQALEEARLQNVNWLNNASAFVPPAIPSFLPTLPLYSWADGQQLGGGCSSSHAAPHVTDDPSNLRRYLEGRATPYKYPYGLLEDSRLYGNYEPNSPSPPPLLPPTRTSDWVSSMAMAAADNSLKQRDAVSESPQWSPLSTQAPLPPVPPPPMPPPIVHPPLSNLPKVNPAPIPKPTEYHALPPKPPPPQPVPPIGMKPDQDPNSKHGIFHVTSSTKEAGSDMKKRGSAYIPNPARTLVMEQLPKTHRHPDFINNWSRSACGTLPVHMFIDGPGGKALIEFATAELARKAWASPKLGGAYAGLKPHQLKGKPREDLIKVWWYRVDGVGAGAGVGEIEEGEIEGDAAEKETEIVTKKETKKERKARLAKEREEKRLRELESRLTKERQAQRERQSQQPTRPTEPQSQSNEQPSSGSVGRPLQNYAAAPINPLYANLSTGHVVNSTNVYGSPLYPSPPVQYPPSLLPYPVSYPSASKTYSNGYANRAMYGASMHDDQGDHESIASSAGRSESPFIVAPSPVVLSTFGQADDLEDYEEVDMEVDGKESSPASPLQPTIPAIPSIHSSLPPRPAPALAIDNHASKVPAQKPPPALSATAPVYVPRPTQMPPQPVVYPMPPWAAPLPKAPLPQLSPELLPAPPTSASSTSSSTTPVPSEPKAMKNAPTEPSYTKRALIARQKELAEKIAKTKMELAAAAAAGKSGTTAVSAQPRPAPPVKPSMDLGEKQAMEDRLRKLVLQSRKPPVKAESTAPSDPLARPPVSISHDEKINTTISSTVSVSAHGFSLEDMAVSFITQTIETMKSQPSPVPDPAPPSVKPMSNAKLELAAKQKRLEDHIFESKSLMAQLTGARTKEEKDNILKIMREKSRLFEEGSHASSGNANSTMTSVMSKTQSKTTTQQFHITRWPVSHQDAGVLILSDDEDEDY
ncbi:hypothetical protein BDZ97DRAFT_1759184 [Flammula alnicola]|nr:hypothetical protein BDZ97DRAFT_1759184 [Flammula alnicola]